LRKARKENKVTDIDDKALITAEERKRADKIINFVFRDSIEECLVTWFGKSNETDACKFIMQSN
jgi:hypothetical protein